MGGGGVVFEKFFGAGIRGDLITKVVQDVGAGGQHDGVVVDDGGMTGLFGGRVRNREGRWAEGGRPGKHGEGEFKNSATGENEFGFDVAAVGGGNGFGGGET